MAKKKFILKQFQLKELSRYSFDLSKIIFGSLVIKMFEPPNNYKLEIKSFLTIFAGLFLTFFTAYFSLILSKEVRDK